MARIGMAVRRSLVMAVALLATVSMTASGADSPAERSVAEIDALIAAAGKSLPEWWNKDFTVPTGLDITWKTQGWKPNENIGTHMFIVCPRPDKWKHAIQVLDKSMAALAPEQTNERKQCMVLMGDFYSRLGDWLRAAYWWRQAGVLGSGDQPFGMALCYWNLGAPKHAVQMLTTAPTDTSRDAKAIRLLAELGETEKALAMAEATARQGAADAALFAAGDVCRRAGKFDAADEYYQKVLDVKSGGRNLANNQKRARQNQVGVRLLKDIKLADIPDGKYTGKGTGYRGEVQVAVDVKGGRIKAVTVVKEGEDREYDAMATVPKRIVARQGVVGVDAVTGATLTSEAIINGVAEALGKK